MRNPIQLTTQAFGMMFSHPGLFIGIVLVPVVVAFVGGLFAPTQAEQMVGVGFSGSYIILMIISMVLNVFMSIALILAAQNISLSVLDAYKASASFFLRYIGMNIIMSVLLFIGFILLIIPGIILAVWFSFSTYVLVLEGKGMIESLKKSREYVRGRWWGVFGRVIAMALVLVVISLVVTAIALILPSEELSNAVSTGLSLVLAPFGVIYLYLMYKDCMGNTASLATE